jgi:Fe-S-cluster-containing hydrogenase component 2
MRCFACSQSCSTDAIEIDEIDTCVRLLEGKTPVNLNEEKCNKCGKCMKICPMGDITSSSKTCSFCIICKSKTSCIILNEDRISFFKVICSIAGLMMLMPRFFFKRNTKTAPK